MSQGNRRTKIERTHQGRVTAGPIAAYSILRIPGSRCGGIFPVASATTREQTGTSPNAGQYTTRSPVEIPLAADKNYRFFNVTPTPAPSISRKDVSKAGFLVIASRYLGSGVG